MLYRPCLLSIALPKCPALCSGAHGDTLSVVSTESIMTLRSPRPTRKATHQRALCCAENWQDFKPPGTRVYEYKRGARTFSVYRATGEDPGVCEYHDRAQCLAPWFIEGEIVEIGRLSLECLLFVWGILLMG